ncbi:hypothetical protein GCK72_024113 [Caenorhabditis remanei]|uniref:Uncharacterized protein n=1 Tax=Caenorhabditis remanei TaxID=31234 RepID=A0A6A5FYA1_CAERE|nr:hypothetical protein GCK72_024113 [Caenorhabditis remanei]KAF1747648.1 hypothetical protein GCK72_024113 [Caenorhabditis remanei]
MGVIDALPMLEVFSSVDSSTSVPWFHASNKVNDLGVGSVSAKEGIIQNSHEYAFGVLGKTPTVKFGECDSKIWTLDQFEIIRVVAVEDVDNGNIVEVLFELLADWSRDL